MVLGVVHLLPLPGSPRAESMDAVIARALRDTRTWVQGGVDGLVLENYGDAPFHPESVPPVTVAAMARVLESLRVEVSIPLGVNVLRNAAQAALSLAAVFDLAFVRVNVHCGATVTDQGLIEGRADATLRLRASLPGHPLILADAGVKHGRPLAPRPLEEEAADLWERGGADAVLLTGTATGAPVSPDDWGRVRASVPDTPLLLASGVTPETIRQTREEAAGWIVGTWAKEGQQTAQAPQRDRVEALVSAARSN